MPGDYNPLLTPNLYGFQEYQGSLREENNAGEVRYFRTFFGPSENRETFLRRIFGSIAVTQDGEEPPCIRKCSDMLFYPNTGWSCVRPPLPSFVVVPEYLLAPYSYRIQPWDDERSHLLGSEATTLGATIPQIQCGVLIEIEYRQAIVYWPAALHDPNFVSLKHTSPSSFASDVPAIISPTWVSVEHEHSLEIRTLKGRLMEICTFGSRTPAVAAGANQNNITRDDLEPWTQVHLHIFTVTMYNIPYFPYDIIRNILGHVNDDVWFGYPAHAVVCTEVNPRMRCHVGNTIRYDVEYKFSARWVPANGEAQGDVMPAPGPAAGRYVHNDMIGVWNRSWWEFPIATTKQHWWPITERGSSDPAVSETWPGEEKNPFKEANFHEAFYWWDYYCDGEAV